VVYRSLRHGVAQALPASETSLVWAAGEPSPALARLVAFARAEVAA
jgi:hypothetical protein